MILRMAMVDRLRGECEFQHVKGRDVRTYDGLSPARSAAGLGRSEAAREHNGCSSKVIPFGGVAVGGCDDAAQLSFAADVAMGSGPEGNIEDVVLDSGASMHRSVL